MLTLAAVGNRNTDKLIYLFYYFVMAKRCKTCSDEISSAEFIKCYGTCTNTFHSKCVSISKTLLNALGANPNIRWYCYDCNLNNPITSSMNEMKESIGQLSNSLSNDLSNFLRAMTTCVTESLSAIATRSAPTLSNLHSQSSHQMFGNGSTTAANSNATTTNATSKRRRGHNSISNPAKIQCNNNRSAKPVAPPVTVLDAHARKSIVVSNIAPDTDVATLSNYLRSKLKSSNDQVRVVTLIPPSIKPEDLKFMQFRVSFPAGMYSAVSSPSIWPSAVRIRDFIIKGSNRNYGSNHRRPIPVARDHFDITVNHQQAAQPVQPANDTPMDAETMPSNRHPLDSENFLLTTPPLPIPIQTVSSQELFTLENGNFSNFSVDDFCDDVIDFSVSSLAYNSLLPGNKYISTYNLVSVRPDWMCDLEANEFGEFGDIVPALATSNVIPSGQDSRHGKRCIYYQNVRWLRSKLEDFHLSSTSCEYDIMALTETNLIQSIQDAEIRARNSKPGISVAYLEEQLTQQS
ncbi:uncharacterized protein LOC119085652 [Bradysia coprophila]|uniref:uncharacterized protein LOC119085652 n=1 Tax=Bradysia coprophila TaxID=38358 RepID=UPI00187D906D|nr:uncharacterized protein LOC119085652 [Bradysia coprophila]